MEANKTNMIPILKSSLPSFEFMLPYLTQIEDNRCHSNFGPLVRQFEARLAELFKVESDEIVLLANGTLALQCALMSVRHKDKKWCLMPSWTFSATPASAVMAGYTPYFLDVDREKQSLTPEMVREAIHRENIDVNQIGAVAVVSPFGSPISRVEWDTFTEETGIPVVIDAAASFDAVLNYPELSVGTSPIMISLHATKLFGIGEGGMILSKNKSLISHIRGLSCFGFDHTRLSSFVGMNAKMSEYQAAVGLGVLDAWPEIRQKRSAVTQAYQAAFKSAGLEAWLNLNYLTSTCNVITPGQAQRICLHLNNSGIESRVWWGSGCHTHKAYSDYPVSSSMQNTRYLSNAMLGVPFSIDTSISDIDRIVETVQLAYFEDSANEVLTDGEIAFAI